MNGLIGVKDLAEFLKVHPNTVYKFVRDGSIPYVKVGGQYRFFKPDIAKWLDGSKSLVIHQ